MIKILHLYNNLMNLYGDYANVIILKKHLLDQNKKVEVIISDTVSDVVLEDFSLIYIGSGTEIRQKLALKDLLLKKSEIHDYINSGKTMLLTGNSFEMLGKNITDSSGLVHDGLGLLDFTVTEQSEKRFTSDVIAECGIIAAPLVGFINKCSLISGITTPFCTLKMGIGNDNKAMTEGMKLKSCYGTHIIGPILVKNPLLLDFFVKKLAEESDTKGFVFTPKDYPYENDAYATTIQKLEERCKG